MSRLASIKTLASSFGCSFLFGKVKPEETQGQPQQAEQQEQQQEQQPPPKVERDGDSESVSDTSSIDVPYGVKQAEAIASTWSKTALVLAYVGVFLAFLVGSLLQQTAGSLTPYVTSEFSKHSLLSTTSVMSSIIGAVAKLPIARMIDIWGRAEGYMLMIGLCTLGLVMMGACRNVETYAAAQVFYWVGYNGMVYVLDVFLADTSSLKNRGWLFAFSTSPYIATTFAGPAIASVFYKTIGWRWAFGTFAVVMPLVSAPVVIIFLRSRKKAEEMGYISKQRSDRKWWQSIVHYAKEFDLVGMILAVAAFSLILLPLNLVTYQQSQWKSPVILAMLAIGVSCVPAFVVWEKFGARNCFIPFRVLSDKMVVGACLLTATLCWDVYFLSYLQVVQGQSIRNAGYIANIFSLGGCIWAIVIGGYIRVTGRFKTVAILAIPLQMLGVGLMIHFRQPGSSIGHVIMCQVLIAISGGTLVICEQLAIMAAASHSELAVVLAILGLFSNIGGAIGQTVSGAIWGHTVPGALLQFLPEAAKGKAKEIYASMPTQLSYPMGSSERDAIIAAYAVGQRWMLIVALGILPLAIIWIYWWRDIQLKAVKQTKGNVV
ncbi:hypothetical protein FQN57_003695 [Myotisia sp. PD_48]|nr:hypothetical protein FQN57_003695 [Myotisia sp. PD_48]